MWHNYVSIVILICLLCRRHESSGPGNTDRTDVHHHHRSDSDHSSSESDHQRPKRDGHKHKKHAVDDKYAAEAGERQSKKYTGSSAIDGDSREDRSVTGHKGKSHRRGRENDKNSEDVREEDVLSRQETHDGKKRKQGDSSEKCVASGISTVNSSADSDSSSHKQKQSRTELDESKVQSKTAKQTVGVMYQDARERYLARKGKSSAPVICEDSD